MKYYLAIDIGASSGRHIVGHVEDDKIVTEEVFRFAGGITELDGSLTWDTEALFRNVKQGIREALRRYEHIESLAIDTWGVDYVLMAGDREIAPCYAYRDGRTKRVIDNMEVPFAELYTRTGIQFAPYNTIYQLLDDNSRGRLCGVTDFLMMPEYLGYRLTGVRKKEYTEATTTGLIDARTGNWDFELIEKIGLPATLFGEIYHPGEELGDLRTDVAEEVGGNIKVVLCPSHDTASAVEAIDMGENDLFLSSGTWSLIGARLATPIITEEGLGANFANEGGAGYICYLKNIMGMWIVNELRKEMCPDMSFGDIVAAARNSDFSVTVNVNDPDFMAPESMKERISVRANPVSLGDYFKCVFLSLAECYAGAISDIERCTGRTYDQLYIVGGGAKNDYLNELTERLSGKKVVALPIEATAIGNIKRQIK